MTVKAGVTMMMFSFARGVSFYAILELSLGIMKFYFSAENTKNFISGLGSMSRFHYSAV